MSNDKLNAHKLACLQCHMADDVTDLCRNGRRIFIPWFQALPEQDKVVFLFRMPKEMQDKVIEMTKTTGITMGEEKEPTN